MTPANMQEEKLRIFATVGAAYSEVFTRPFRLAKAIIVPILLSLAIGELSAWIEMIAPLWEMAVNLAYVLPFVIFSIIWQRLVILGDDAGHLMRAITLRRFGLTLFYTSVAGFILVLPWVVYMASLLGPHELGLPEWFAISGVAKLGGAFGAAYALLVGLVARFSLVFPFCAIDSPMGLRDSWRVTKGNGIQLSGATILASIPVVVVMVLLVAVLIGVARGLESIPPDKLDGPKYWTGVYGVGIVANFLQLTGMAIIASVFSIAYRDLRVDRSQSEFLDRFD